jgi:hypothetical protein
MRRQVITLGDGCAAVGEYADYLIDSMIDRCFSGFDDYPPRPQITAKQKRKRVQKLRAGRIHNVASQLNRIAKTKNGETNND